MDRFSISREDVIPDIAPNDEMNDSGFTGSLDHYFSVGRSGLECIEIALRAAHKAPEDVQRILDLPCGHGRVLRYVRRAFPTAEITACDLATDGVDWCAKMFGALPVYSHKDFAQIPLGDKLFDLIWVGSLLTHLDAELCTSFLEIFSRRLRPGGVLVFSTHGRLCYQWMLQGRHKYGLNDEQLDDVLGQVERGGFGYSDYHAVDGYGITLHSPEWVIERINKLPETRLVHLAEAAWDGHHDIYACVRDPEWKTALRVRRDVAVPSVPQSRGD